MQATNINIGRFLHKFNKEYNFLYEADVNHKIVPGYDEAVDAFDSFIMFNGDFVGEFAKYRGDFISSDREAAAFMFAMEEFL